MARAVLLAALVLCAAAALAHAGRLLQEEEGQLKVLGFESGPWLQAPAEAPSPYAGGVATRGAGGSGGYGDAIVDVMWFLIKWANDAYAAAGRRTDQ
ncbi:unnamed protein product [Alopecurus aequalis]